MSDATNDNRVKAISSIVEKMIGERPKLEIYNGVFNMYHRCEFRVHNRIMLLGLDIFMKDLKQKHFGEGDFEPPEATIIIRNEDERQHIFDLIEADFPDLENVVVITLSKIKSLAKLDIRTKGPIVWSSYAILQYAHVGELMHQNLGIMEKIYSRLD